MNILVISADGRISLRPDTTINKNNEDFYVPDEIGEVTFVPVVFFRMGQAGKGVQRQFASRYYDAFNFGVFISPDADCMYDKSSLLPLPLYSMAVADSSGNEFVLDWTDGKGGRHRFVRNTEGLSAIACSAVEKISANTSLRRGDYIAVELTADVPLLCSGDRQAVIHASFCGNETVDIAVKF